MLATGETKTSAEVQPAQRPAPKDRGGILFRHSLLDLILVVIAFAHVAAIGATMYYYDSLGWPALVAIGIGLICLTSTNYQCVAHNFIHNAFFSQNFLNQAFGILNSLSLGMPQTLYHFHHLNHHKYNSDYRDPETNECKDFSSLYRFSRKPDRAENIWTYSLIGPFRFDLGVLFQIARQKNLGWLVALETIALVAFYAGLAYWNWQAFLIYFVPVFFLGQSAALAENYLEHKGADPSSRLTDSVSCYNGMYNFLWFNNGYHQEHHYRPYVHWTKIHEVKAKMLPESERRVVRGAHLGNLFG